MFTAGRGYMLYPSWGNLKRVVANSTMENNSMIFAIDQLNQVKLYTFIVNFIPNFALTKGFNVAV